MTRKRLKHYLPRGLMGRAAMILFVPIITLQIIISIHFIQNHLEDVTRQMSDNTGRALREIEYLASFASNRAAALADIEPVARAMGMDTAFLQGSTVPEGDEMSWWDFSGHIISHALRRDVPGLRYLSFNEDRLVVAVLTTTNGPLELRFSRRLVAVVAPHQLIVTTLGFGALMAAIAFAYLRNQMRPIKQLSEAAEAFGRGQSVQYHPRGATEVRAAGAAFLAMRARIERHIEQRTLILSGVSHDLRTPLTRLKLGLAMLDEEDAGPLVEDVEEMERLIDEFLAFSRGAAGTAAEPVDARALMERIAEDAERAGLPVTLRNGEDHDHGSETMLRPAAMRRAVENLMGNAVRYGSHVELSLDETDRNVTFRIEDDGPGIPAELRGEALKPFARLDPSRNQNSGGGVGLGLAIAADVARVHGGRLQLGDSETLGGLKAEIVVPR